MDTNQLAMETSPAANRTQAGRRGGLLAVLTLALVMGTLACYWPAGRLGFLLYEDPFGSNATPYDAEFHARNQQAHGSRVLTLINEPALKIR
jgi:hypothetical protein